VNPVTYAFGILAALLALVAIIELMRRSTLRERHAIWWLVGGVLALVVAIFPGTLTWAAKVLGIAVPTNLAFFIAIALLFLVSLQYGAELTRVEDKLRSLAEQSAFQDLRLRALEAQRAADEAAVSGEPGAGASDGDPEAEPDGSPAGSDEPR
jgi:hypothetical protein